MVVLVASSTSQPLWEPATEDLGRELEIALRDHGHEVESIRIPFDRDPSALWAQLFAFRLANVSDVADLLVATGTPCHLLRHRRKVLWLTEHYPWLDDDSAALRSLGMADRQAWGEADAVFAASDRLCDRVARSSGHTLEPLPPPPQGSWDRIVAAVTTRDRAPNNR
jgi:hypothetical protein